MLLKGFFKFFTKWVVACRLVLVPALCFADALDSGGSITLWDMFKNFKHLRKTRHSHDPVDDARGNAEALLEMKEQYDLKIRL